MINFNSRDIERMSKGISSTIEDELLNLGLFHRIIYRCKTTQSIIEKLERKKYDGINSFMRDVIGVRINLFFADDMDIIYDFLRNKFEFVEETIDKNEETEFKPTRINVIFRIPKKYNNEFKEVVNNKKIDNTFELQLRTVLSEGWHEVDHDLRYKCVEDWQMHSDLARMFNGILAALETNDWSILKLFEQLSYRHYRNSNWQAMIRTKFRLRIVSKEISKELENIINVNNELQKMLFKIDRTEFLKKILEKAIIFPYTMENIIFLLNFLFIKNEKILKITPNLLLKEFSN